MTQESWDSVKEEIRSRIPIETIIGEQVRLKRSGSRYSGLCPFHNEKTPSFTVDPVRGFYHCFGCKAGGDLFSFVMATRNLDFVEAMRYLAERAGVDMPSTMSSQQKTDEERQERNDAKQLLAFAADWYHRVLLQSGTAAPVRTYLEERGFSLECGGLMPGFSPSHHHLPELLQQKSIPLELAAKYGLLHKQSGQFRDRFSQRLIFPIRNRIGEVVGFGGRVLAGFEADLPKAKYINTAETPLFHKSEILYGYAASLKLGTRDTVVLTEGYLDVGRLLQEGIPACAPLGTAFTEQQARLLARGFAEVVLAFDGDSAGEKAFQKALPILVNAGVPVSRLALPETVDVDSYFKDDPSTATAMIKQAPPAIEHFLDTIAREAKDVQARQIAVRQILEFLQQLEDQAVIADIQQLCQERFSLSIQASSRPNRAVAASPERSPAPRPTHKTSLTKPVLQLIANATTDRRRTSLLETNVFAILPEEFQLFLRGEGTAPLALAETAVSTAEMEDEQWYNLLEAADGDAVSKRKTIERELLLARIQEAKTLGQQERVHKLQRQLQDLYK